MIYQCQIDSSFFGKFSPQAADLLISAVWFLLGRHLTLSVPHVLKVMPKQTFAAGVTSVHGNGSLKWKPVSDSREWVGKNTGSFFFRCSFCIDKQGFWAHRRAPALRFRFRLRPSREIPRINTFLLLFLSTLCWESARGHWTLSLLNALVKAQIKQEEIRQLSPIY